MLWLILIGLPLLIMIGIYVVFAKEAKKNNKKTNWFAIILSFIPVILFFGFFIVVYWHGTSDNYKSYDNHPSISDEDWLKDNYGGTEYYP